MKFRMACLLLCLASAPSWSKVTPAAAEHLRNRLTPLGGERAGNAQGTIPEWRGGLTAPPACHRPGARYCDPYAGEEPYAVITAANVDAWSDKLSAGQLEMLLRQGQTYRVPVYASRRSFANPPAIYEAAFRNATSAELAVAGNAVRGATVAIPFPIPKEGQEPLWNHRLRYQGPGFLRSVGQAIVTASGQPSLGKLRESAYFPYALDQMEDGVPMMWLSVVTQPVRMNDFLTLVHETLDPAVSPRRVWRRVPDGRVVRPLNSFGYDSPAMYSEDLRFDDQIDGFVGGLDRYFWRIDGKRELVVPYNSYRIHSGRNSLRDLIRPAHLDPQYGRYELHRVWVVEANVRPGAVHRYKRRTFYLDEDSWQILMVDLYDGADRLWRWQEVHTVMAYDRGVLMPAVEASFDLQSGRYIVQGLDEGDPEVAERQYSEDDFDASGASRRSRKETFVSQPVGQP